MKTKDDTVNMGGLMPVMWHAIAIIDRFWMEHLGYPAVCTSACDGKHSPTSRHYQGMAIDLRTWDDSRSGVQLGDKYRKELAIALQRELGDNFFVLNESHHFHVSFKPVGRPWTDNL